MVDGVQIRECATVDELDACVHLQRDVFGLPDLEISPRRHLIVSRQAGGWTLGAFENDGQGRLVGFVHHLAAVSGEGKEVFGYSHMMAVDRDYQNKGVGARLKWAQRERALAEGRNFIKWTWDPLQARNAHFNLNRLGVTVGAYALNFYGTDYGVDPERDPAALNQGIDSDRLFAGWQIRSERVQRLAAREALPEASKPEREIVVPPDWGGLIKRDKKLAQEEQLRVRAEFQEAFASGLVCAGFERSPDRPKYLLYKRENIWGIT